MKSIFLALVMVASGCGSGQADNESVQIEFWHSFVHATQPSLNRLIEEFERLHPGIRVREQYVPTGDALIQKLVASVGSGTPPDISWVHADFLDKLVQAQSIYPIEHFLALGNGLARSDLADFFPAVLENATWRDTLYALPMEATSLALMVNRDLFRAAGLDPDVPPSTWEELESVAEQLTIDTDGDGRPESYGFFVPVFPASGSLNLWMVLQWTPFLWQAGGHLVDEDQTRVLYASDAGVQALSLWRRIHHALNLDRVSMTHDLGFVSQRLAMVLDGPWSLPRYREAADFDWGVAPLPAGPAGRATYLAGEHLAIFRASDHADAAWTFASWVTRPEVQARFSMDSGYLPVRQSTLELPEYRAFLEQDQAMAAFVEQMAIARSRRPMDFGRVEINRHIAEAIEQAIIGHEDPAAALERASRKSNQILGTTK